MNDSQRKRTRPTRKLADFTWDRGFEFLVPVEDAEERLVEDVPEVTRAWAALIHSVTSRGTGDR